MTVFLMLYLLGTMLSLADEALRLVSEMKFSVLLERRLEPSGVVALDDFYYVVFDNRKAIGQLQ